MENEILDYIQKCQGLGLTEQEINEQLKSAGWQENQIAAAWENLKQTSALPGLPISKPFWKNYKLLLPIAAGIILLGGGGYFAYAKYSSSPERIWKSASQNLIAVQSGHLRVEGSYMDTVQKNNNSDQSGNSISSIFGNFRDITISLTGEGDFRSTPKQPDFSLTSTAGVKLGGFNLSIELESRKVGENLYYKLGQNPLGELFGVSSTNDQKSDWLKIDLARKSDPNNPLSKLSDEQINQIQDAFKKLQLVKPAKLLGTEEINGKTTWHYQATLDKEELRRYLEQIAKIISVDQTAPDIKPLVDKLDLRKIEVWIGKYDRQIYQVYLESSAPSVINPSLQSAQSKARDARRLAEIRQMMTAAELFFNDNNRYPKAANGLPDANDGTPKFSSYFRAILHAPTPPDGNCTPQNNLYWYEQTNNGQSYKLTFCLGNPTGGFQAGVAEASPTGIKNADTSGQPPAPPPNPFLNWPFTGTLKLKINLSNINKPVKLEAPPGAIDYFRKQKNEKAQSNARALQDALRSYYYNHNSYPNSLQDLLSEKYSYYFSANTLPKPLNTEGVCTSINDNFNYQPSADGKDYFFEFCLTEKTGTREAGKHTATKSGIDGVSQDAGPMPEPF